MIFLNKVQSVQNFLEILQKKSLLEPCWFYQMVIDFPSKIPINNLPASSLNKSLSKSRITGSVFERSLIGSVIT